MDEEELFAMDIEAFPDSEKAYLTFQPIPLQDNPEESFEIEVPREETSLVTVLSHLDASPEEEHDTFLSFAQTILGRNVGSAIVPKQRMGNLIDLYCGTPDKNMEAFPGDEEQDPIDFEIVIREKKVLKKAIYLNNRLIEKGTRVVFTHRGRIQ
jgi:hypothetical protein